MTYKENDTLYPVEVVLSMKVVALCPNSVATEEHCVLSHEDK